MEWWVFSLLSFVITDFTGKTESLNYFDFTDVVEKEVVRVQSEEPCAPGYIDASWLDDSYAESIQDELNEECVDDCGNEKDVDACKAQCKEVSRSDDSVRSTFRVEAFSLSIQSGNAR